MDQQVFLADLLARAHEHQTWVHTRYIPLSGAQLGWSPRPGEWSILQCIEHLNQTHDYYNQRIDKAAAASRSQTSVPGSATTKRTYKPSFWAKIYMAVAFNPRFSFPAPPQTRPTPQPDPEVVDIFLANQDKLCERIALAEEIDLATLRIFLKPGIAFNLGDCLKTLVYHDRLHLDQAQRVLQAQSSRPPSE